MIEYTDKSADEAVDVVAKSYDWLPPDVMEASWVDQYQSTTNTSTLKSVCLTEDWAFACCDAIASEVSRVYPVVKRRVVTDGTETTEPAQDHPVQALLNNPNTEQGTHSWLYSMAFDYVAGGNGLTFFGRRSGQLIPIPVETLMPEFNSKTGLLESYVWSPVYTNTPASSEYMRLKRQDVLHIRRPNPSSVYWGLSPFLPASRALQQHRYSQEYVTSFYQKGATPQVTLEVDNAVSEQALMRLLRSFEQAYTGRRNQRRALVLPKGVKANPINLTIADQKLIETIRLNRETILAVLRIPKHVMGLQESGSLGSEEHKTALRYFWDATIQPILRIFSTEMDRFFAQMLGPDHFIEWDTTQVDVLAEGMDTKADTATKLLQAGWSVNEVRAKFWELEEVEGGDVLLPLESIPKANPLAAFGLSKPPPAPVVEEQRDTRSPAVKFLDAKKDILTTHWKALESEESRGMGLIAIASLDLFRRQALEAIKLIPEIMGEGEKGRVLKISDTELKRRLSEAFDALEPKWGQDYTEALTATVETGTEIQLGLAYFEPNPDQLRALVAEDTAGRRALLAERGLDSFKTITNTSAESVLNVIQEALGKNATPQEVAQAIAAKAKEWPDYRMERIARTETLTALSVGQGATLEIMAKEYPTLQKMWLTADDTRVRDSHAALHAEAVPIKKDFGNGLAYPRELGSPPEESIQCRCSVVTVLPEDLEDLRVDFPA